MLFDTVDFVPHNGGWHGLLRGIETERASERETERHLVAGNTDQHWNYLAATYRIMINVAPLQPQRNAKDEREVGEHFDQSARLGVNVWQPVLPS